MLRIITPLIVVVLMLAVIAGSFWNKKTPMPANVAVIPVLVAEVKRQDFPLYAQSVGRVQASHTVDIRPQIDAILQHIAVQEGQYVKKGAELARLDDREIRANLEQIKAQVDVAVSQLDLAEIELKRFQDLRNQGAISEQEIDRQAAQVRQLQASVKSYQATLAAQEVQLSYTRIHAPISGVVGIHNIHEGNVVRSNDVLPLFTLVQLNPIAVEFALPQSLLLEVLPLKQSADKALVNIYRGDAAELLAQGTLSTVDNRIASNSGTLRLKAQVNNNDGKLWPEQAVVVDLQLGIINQALVVSQKALKQGAQGHFVWRIDENNHAQTVAVKVIKSDTDWAVVEGINEGDQVVIDGQYRLSEGAVVEVRKLQENAHE